ncbi:MAG TPA: AraC family ligand binding domain-containing protein, partial [Ottowia sp.]|nr:AraC family ligand binding domain-containing protein [Ottowia sp.]
NQLEVMRLVLPAGHRMPPHHVPGEITIQCLEGVVRVDVAAASHDLPAGHLMYVAGGVEHALTAIESASVLVTIAL